MPNDVRPESDHCPFGVIVWAEGPVRARAWAREEGLDWAERDHHIQPLAPVGESGEMQNMLDDAVHEATESYD